MPRLILLCAIVALFCLIGSAQIRPLHTFSIVARDSATGQLGVAVQSHWFSVGPLVPWAEAGVGAVATQSFVDPAYGPLGLDLMRAGKTAKEALTGLLAADAALDVRQVAMVDAKGNVAAHTGKKCIPAAGHIEGEQFTVEANLMLNDKVWPAMAKAYRETKGDLADRMLAALDAAQSVGGDIRGKQSAAMLIVSGQSTGRFWKDRILDLRVEDSPEPLAELRRLIHVQRAYQRENAGDLAVEKNDVDGALREYTAAEQMMPENIEMKYWHAVALVNAGRIDASLPIFKAVFEADPNWIDLTRRLPNVFEIEFFGLIKIDVRAERDPSVIERPDRVDFDFEIFAPVTGGIQKNFDGFLFPEIVIPRRHRSDDFVVVAVERGVEESAVVQKSNACFVRRLSARVVVDQPDRFCFFPRGFGQSAVDLDRVRRPGNKQDRNGITPFRNFSASAAGRNVQYEQNA